MRIEDSKLRIEEPDLAPELFSSVAKGTKDNDIVNEVAIAKKV